MDQLFVTLTHAVESSPLIAISASFAWGILSIILSPCHLASLPLIVGFISGQGKISVKRAFVISSAFAVGILITIGIIGLITAAMGKMLGDTGAFGNYIVAVVFLIVGLHLLDVIPLSFSGPKQVGLKQKGIIAAFLLGLIFGIALGPCTFAYMAPVLVVTMKTASTQILYSIALLLAYGFGHCFVIVLAGTFSEVVQRYLDWNEKSKGSVIVKKVCGALVIIGGIYLIFK
ncbi:MAG: cytochrome C biogenesis protein [Candidatus Firestonebacteria bacterium]|nr:cytochrome C biogenesis protein [Candidatus Firestonebacteria bacterium]